LRRSGFSLVISSSDEDPELEQQDIEHLLSRGVDALLIASTQRSAECLRGIEARRVPYILLDRWFSRLAANFVGVNDEVVGTIATEPLLEIGCRNVAHTCGTNVARREGD
jgi:LacI family transcriptional regulator